MTVDLMAAIEITTVCNFACPHCFTDSCASRKNELSFDQIKKLLDDLAALGVSMVAISGGEPFLRQDLHEIMSFGKKLGMEFTIVTNGSLCNEENLRLLKEDNLVSLQVSLDGPDPETNSKIRACSKEDFYRAVRTMRIARDLGIYVTMGTFLHKDTIDMLNEFVSLADALGIYNLRYASFVPTGRGKNIKIIKSVQPSLRQLKNFVAEVEKINEAQRSVKILLDCSTGPISSKYPYTCTAGTNLIYIGASGDVYPCTAYSSKEASLGNMLTTPLREIVKKAGEFQGSLVDKKKKLGKCSRCTNDNCFGGCPGVISAYYGRLDRSFPFCIAYHG